MKRLLLCLALLTVAAEAAPLRAELRSARGRYWLGENVLLHFVVTNPGPGAATIDVGGDYRGAPRSTRFEVEAHDQTGKMLEDPHPNPICFGGLSTRPVLRSGETYTLSLALCHYRRFDRPGRYKIEVRHDLGLPEKLSASLVLEWEKPDPARARDLVRAAATAGPRPSGTWGKPYAEYADFSLFSDPVYLQPLRELANEQALEGLTQMPDPRAAEAMIELAERPQLLGPALKSLNFRLPDPQWAGKLGPRGPFETRLHEERQRLQKLGWSPSLAPKVRRLAVRALTQNQTVAGAFALECLGKPEDLPAVMQALDISLNTPPETDIYPRPRGATQELERAARVILKSGARPPRAPDTPALRLIQLIAGGDPIPALDCSNSYVRAAGLAAVKEPKAHSQRILELLKDPDPDVAVAACERAADLPDLTPELVTGILTRHHDVWALRAATQLCLRHHWEQAARQSLAPRLTQVDDWQNIFLQLLDLSVERVPGHSISSTPSAADLQRLSQAWLNYRPTGLVPARDLPPQLLPDVFKFSP